MNYTCPNCGDPYEYAYKVTIAPDGTKYCIHDHGSIGGMVLELSTSKRVRKLQSDRTKYAKDILQPYKKDGSLNKDFVKAYGKPKPIKPTMQNKLRFK